MFYQTDPKLQFKADEDCYLFDILKIHELVGNHEFTYKQVNNIRKVSTRADFMEEDGYLNAKGISGVASVASGLTQKHVYIKRVGSNDNYNYIIALYGRRTNNSKLVQHFVLANFEQPNKVIDWDSWSKDGSKTGKEGYSIGYRYIWAELI